MIKHPRRTIEKTAKELLKDLMKERGWHRIKNDKKAQNLAGVDKALHSAGKLSAEKCEWWLNKLGYRKIKEVWEVPGDQ